VVVALIHAAIASRVVPNRLGKVLDFIIAGQAEPAIVGIAKQGQNQNAINEEEFGHRYSSLEWET